MGIIVQNTAVYQGKLLENPDILKREYVCQLTTFEKIENKNHIRDKPSFLFRICGLKSAVKNNSQN